MVLVVFERLVVQFFLDIVIFPFWWYTMGLFRVVRGLGRSIAETNQRLAPGLWFKNMFTPMYGQHDIEGRLMSVFMRIVNIIGRSIALIVWIGITGIGLLLWLLLPIALIALIVSVFLPS